ncbi:MAG: ribonuclease P protein component, partial [Actinomycetota bacterium]
MRDRRDITALRRHGRRARSGPITVLHRPRPEREDIRVAYAVGRPVGNAVTRNRVRRRLRSSLRELVDDRAVLPPGDVLVSAGPTAV